MSARTVMVRGLPRFDRLECDYIRQDRADLKQDLEDVVIRATGRKYCELTVLKPVLSSTNLSTEVVGYRLIGSVEAGWQKMAIHLCGFCCELFMAMGDVGMLDDPEVRADAETYLYARGNAIMYFTYRI